MLLRSSLSVHLIDKSTAGEIRAYLGHLSSDLERLQNTDGSWDGSWSGTNNAPYASLNSDQRVSRLSATGHALEWMAFAPPECRPPDRVIRAGVRSLVRDWPEIVKLIEADWHRYYPATHAGRAIWMLSGLKTPPHMAVEIGGE